MLSRTCYQVVLPIAAGLFLVACSQKAAAPTKVKPATVEHVEGSELARLTLTERAAQRLDIKTMAVNDAAATGAGRRTAVPYGAVLYDAKGETWVYTNPEPLVFVRHRIHVDYIRGDQAVLSDGPPVGTKVVTQGGAELFGAEFEIGH